MKEEKNKNIEHKKKEICRLTGREIDTEKESYYILLDCFGDEVEQKWFFKKEEFDSLIQGNGEAIKKDLMEKTMNKSRKLLNHLGVNV